MRESEREKRKERWRERGEERRWEGGERERENVKKLHWRVQSDPLVIGDPVDPHSRQRKRLNS